MTAVMLNDLPVPVFGAMVCINANIPLNTKHLVSLVGDAPVVLLVRSPSTHHVLGNGSHWYSVVFCNIPKNAVEANNDSLMAVCEPDDRVCDLGVPIGHDGIIRVGTTKIRITDASRTFATAKEVRVHLRTKVDPMWLDGDHTKYGNELYRELYESAGALVRQSRQLLYFCPFRRLSGSTVFSGYAYGGPVVHAG